MAPAIDPAILRPAEGSSRPPRTTAAVREAHALRDAALGFPTLAALRAATGYPGFAARLDALLGTVRGHAPQSPPAPPRDPGEVHLVHWNIEHGNRYAQVEAALRTHPRLAGADLVLLNEVDLGCARAANRDVTGDLADALGLHAAFAPMYLEGTLGRDDDAACADGRDNEESLFGVAVLSRWPIARARLVPLPGPDAVQFDLERMVGRFVALVCDIAHPVTPFVAVSVHLEVHRTRAHRAAQMQVLMDALAAETRPVVLAGDFNAHTFDRGLWHSSLAGAWPLLVWPGAALARRFLHPDRGRHRETLFAVLAAAGFTWDACNDREPTLQVRFDRLDEVGVLPAPLRRASARVLAWAEARARLRLDWVCMRGWDPARVHGATVHGLDGRGRASDHAPLAAWFGLPR
jgi:endonuclease/exonuclease/phosphatase family metal-dependent hydrolase